MSAVRIPVLHFQKACVLVICNKPQSGIGDDIFGQTYLAGNLYSERTARIAYLQQEQCLHQMAVIEHGAVYYTFVVFGKMFQILIVCGDDTERLFLVEAFQYGFLLEPGDRNQI